MENDNLRRAVENFSNSKLDREDLVTGVLGMPMGGANQVVCANRPGYVWVRIRGSIGEFVQAYNDAVPPVYGMPVLVGRNPVDRNRYYIVSNKDSWSAPAGVALGQIEYWGSQVTKVFLPTGLTGQVLVCQGSPIWQTRGYPIWFQEELTNPSFTGAVSTGTSVMTCTDFNASIPITAKALVISVGAKWAVASDSSYVAIHNDNAFGNGLVVRALVANIHSDSFGIITLNPSSEFKIIVAGANILDMTMGVWGYFR